ncbi:MAG: hypothetical protein BMS9Abin06_0024 [Gammaproteobacteria bacterium]|nr:MAG: hypothetical protein BMS9Abin06_0024 [Gammaproteobacteria bacterium]
MQRIGFFFLLVTLGVAFAGSSAVGDTLLVDAVTADAAVARPARGMSMDQVLQQYGEPQQRLGPVGEPPITHWVYSDAIVYFEHLYVIHSVVPHKN